MITNTGKTIATMKVPDGTVLNIFNRTFYSWGKTINFQDDRGKSRYSIAIDQSYISNQYRCACFTRSFANNAIGMTPYILLYVPDLSKTTDNGTTAYPLFELISPSINYTGNIYQLTWWSNVKDYSKLENVNGIYKYDAEKIKRFSQSTIATETESNTCGNILCTAQLYFEKLKQTGSGAFDSNIRMTPIIRNIAIVTLLTGQGYITDFSSGGGDGGIGMHSHLSNNDGGFSAAVFMPSAIMKPFTWS